MTRQLFSMTTCSSARMSINEKLRRERNALRSEAVEKISALASAAFGLVAALAWNNAIQALFKRYYPAPDDPSALGPLTLYALLVTLLAVAVIIYIGRVAGRLKARADEDRADAGLASR